MIFVTAFTTHGQCPRVTGYLNDQVELLLLNHLRYGIMHRRVATARAGRTLSDQYFTPEKNLTNKIKIIVKTE